MDPRLKVLGLFLSCILAWFILGGVINNLFGLSWSLRLFEWLITPAFTAYVVYRKYPKYFQVESGPEGPRVRRVRPRVTDVTNGDDPVVHDESPVVDNL
jgi:hypothetical protein